MYLKYLKYTLKSIWYNNWKARLPIYLKKKIYFYEMLNYALMLCQFISFEIFRKIRNGGKKRF